MKKNWGKILCHPVIILILLLILPPLGLVLIGNHPKIKLGTKVCTGFLLGSMLIILLLHFQIAPRTQSGETPPLDIFTYQFLGFHYSPTALNSFNDTFEAEDGFIFAKVEISVINQSKKEQFYVSLVDQPKLYTDQESYSPDLTLSRDPFGYLDAQSRTKGYFIFIIPKEENAVRFLIADQEFDINP